MKLIGQSRRRFAVLAVFAGLIFYLRLTNIRRLRMAKRNTSYVTLCPDRLTGNHRLGNHLFMLSAVLDLADKTQRSVIMPSSGWYLDQDFDFNHTQLNDDIEEVLQIERYESRDEICPGGYFCKTIKSPHFDYDARFDDPDFLEAINQDNETTLELCGLSQTYLHARNPQVTQTLRLLPPMLKDDAYDKALTIINLFKQMMVDGKLNSFALYSYNGLENHSYISLKSYLSSESSSPPNHANWKNQEPLFIGIHARMGDFLETSNQDYGLTVADRRYFRRSLKYFIKPNVKVVFVVLSDDIQWAMENFTEYFNSKSMNSSHSAKQSTKRTIFDSENVKIVFFRDTKPQDFALLCRFEALIISTGTFGWWAAWFNDGAKVVYYENYPRHDSDFAKYLNKRNYYLQHWIPMS